MLYLTLGQLSDIINSLEDRVYDFGIERVFSWRGMYAEPAFKIGSNISTRHMLRVLISAYADTFEGWKGGEFTYDADSYVNFEGHERSYTDGDYIRCFLTQHKDSDFAKALNNAVNSSDEHDFY